MLDLKIRKRLTEALGGYCWNILPMERYVLEIERIVALFMNIRHTSDLKGVCFAIVTYVHMHLNKPLCYIAADKLEDLKELAIFKQVTQFVEQSGTDEVSWIAQFKQLYSEFKIYRDSNFSNSVTQLINYVVSIGLCSASRLTFTAGNLQLFAPVAYQNQISATSFMDAVVNTVVSFLEGGYRVYSSKKLSAFFFCETELLDFERKFAVCNDYSGYISTGNLLEMKEVTEDEYMKLLSDTIDMGTKILESMIFKKEKSSPEKLSLDRKLFCLRNWRSDYEQSKVRGDLREAPFALSFFGESGVGKTSLTSVSITTIGLFNNIDVSSERRQIWADNDKFASNIRSSTNVICFDDLANTKAQFMQDSPNYRLIQTINNALFLAPMAEAHMKGKVALRPKIVTVTTNKQNLDAPTYSNKPESVLRRMFHITVRLDPRFKNGSGMIDEQAVRESFGNSPAPDIWILDVNQCIVGVKVAGKTEYAIRPIEWFDPIQKEKFILKGVRIHVYLRWLQHTSKAHYDHQRQLVSKMKPDLSAKPCSECGLFFCNSCLTDDEDDLDTHYSARLPPARPLQPQIVMSEIPGHDVISDITIMHDSMKQHLDEAFSDSSFSEQAGPLLGVFILQQLWGLTCWLFVFMLSFTISSIGFTIMPQFLLNPLMRFLRWYMFRIYRAWVRVLYVNNGRILENFNDLRNITTHELVRVVAAFEGSWLDWICYLPSSCLDNKLVLYSHMVVRSGATLYGIVFTLCLFSVACVCIAIDGVQSISLIGAVWSFVVYVSVSLYHINEKRALRRELELRHDRAPVIVKYMRDRYLRCIVGSALVVVLIRSIINMWKSREALFEQGNVNPANMSDIEARDKEINVWARAFPQRLPLYGKCRTTTGPDLAKVCGRQTFYAESLWDISRTPRQTTRVFSINTYCILVPKHFIESNLPDGTQSFYMRIYTGPKENVGNSFITTISRSKLVHLDCDATLVYVNELGSRKNLIEYFPEEHIQKDMRCIFVHRDPSFDLNEYTIRAQKGEYPYGERVCRGVKYFLPRTTEFGMCMSPLIAHEFGTFIVGFHIGGQQNGPAGCAQTILRGDVETAYSTLMGMAHVLRGAEACDMLNEQFGTAIVDAPLHYKSAVNFLTKEDCHVEVLGGHSVRSTPRSSVVQSVISPYVHQIMGIEQQWGPPKMSGGYYPYQVALDNIAHQSLEIGDELPKAFFCYLSNFFDIYNSGTKKIFLDAKPLNEVEIVCGKEKCRFIDPMSLSTSPGFPFTGDKRNLVEFVSGYEDTHQEAKRFKPEIRIAIEEAEEKLANRQRIYVPWKAALKDEPTNVKKTKTRVFQCAPIIIQAILRKYYLPLIRIMQLHSIKTECAVGCNAEGPEWDQLYTHMMTFPNKFGGDYSAYDQRMPSQLICTAFKILIHVAKMTKNYSDRDLIIMDSIVTEIVNPVIIYDGAVLMLFGSNPSGQNLTVIINCIVNSLLLRCAYYSIYSDQPISDFRKHVALQTYGDDVLGSVSDKRKRFNVISVSDYLGRFNIKFTSPSKEKAVNAFLEPHELEFLKRTNINNPDLGCGVGVLAEKSIYKRLHSHIRSAEMTLEMQSAENIDTSLKDFFFFGREKFEEMHSKLENVARAAGIYELCRGFERSYDERVIDWKSKYFPEDNPPKSIGGL